MIKENTTKQTERDGDYPKLYKWSKETRLADIEKLYEDTYEKAVKSIEWYTKSAKNKKSRAQNIRWLSLFLLGLGSIFPVILDTKILNPIWSNIPASIATLILAVGTGLIYFDRYLGYSTGWMRFISSELKLKQLLEKFEYDWNIERIAWDSEIPTVEQAKVMVLRCATLRQEIAKIVQDETQAWMHEFQSNLQNLDENFKTIMVSNKSGALELSIENGDTYTYGWLLYINGQSRGLHKGNKVAVKDISAGFYEIKIEALDENGEVNNTTAVIINIEPSQITERTIFLAKYDENNLDESVDSVINVSSQ